MNPISMENEPTPEQLKDAAIEKALDALVEVLNERPKDDNWMKKANQRKADLSSALRNYYGGSMPPSLHKASWLAIERKVMRRLPLGEAANVLPIWSKIRNDYLLNLARKPPFILARPIVNERERVINCIKRVLADPDWEKAKAQPSEEE